jgi:hypothetical protein
MKDLSIGLAVFAIGAVVFALSVVNRIEIIHQRLDVLESKEVDAEKAKADSLRHAAYLIRADADAKAYEAFSKRVEEEKAKQKVLFEEYLLQKNLDGAK